MIFAVFTMRVRGLELDISWLQSEVIEMRYRLSYVVCREISAQRLWVRPVCV
jgi:hypothetical protein